MRSVKPRSSGRGTTLSRWPRDRLPVFEAGGGGRTRTYEVIRRLIYSQLPLPLGTPPRSTAESAKPSQGAADMPWTREDRDGNRHGSRPGAFMTEAPCQSQPMESAQGRPRQPKLPLFGTREPRLKALPADRQSRKARALPSRISRSLAQANSLLAHENKTS